MAGIWLYAAVLCVMHRPRQELCKGRLVEHNGGWGGGAFDGGMPMGGAPLNWTPSFRIASARAGEVLLHYGLACCMRGVCMCLHLAAGHDYWCSWWCLQVCALLRLSTGVVGISDDAAGLGCRATSSPHRICVHSLAASHTRGP